MLVVVFLAGAWAVILPATQTGPMGDTVPGGFWIALGATFGYAAGWNPYASDYSRYLPPGTAGGRSTPGSATSSAARSWRSPGRRP